MIITAARRYCNYLQAVFWTRSYRQKTIFQCKTIIDITSMYNVLSEYFHCVVVAKITEILG